MDISANPECYSMGKQKARGDKLLPDAIPVRPWLLQEIPAQVRTRWVSLLSGMHRYGGNTRTRDIRRFEAVRSEMVAVNGADTTPDNVVERMCRDENTWDAVNGAVAQIMGALQQKWRDDQQVRNNEWPQN